MVSVAQDFWEICKLTALHYTSSSTALIDLKKGISARCKEYTAKLKVISASSSALSIRVMTDW